MWTHVDTMDFTMSIRFCILIVSPSSQPIVVAVGLQSGICASLQGAAQAIFFVVGFRVWSRVDGCVQKVLQN